MYYVIGVVLGLIPEVLYFTLFLSKIKNLTGKRVKLFLLTSIAYLLCIMIQQYKILYYILFIVSVYVILKLLYKKKTQIIDIFIISILAIYLTITSYICFKFVTEDFSNYFLYLFIHRIILFFPLIFGKGFNKLYKKYYSLWNRNYNRKQPVKSITLRNISLILLNLFIFILNLIILYLLTKVK